ncbi:aldehyde dehydrogenase [Calothrix sp. PCC 6303]|uniref:aldehyde dehydrogenase n=1 Tax=Calothrix sp. PCC 6303 TaxID=1170562 RepID=UPI0002A03F1E|nr:aldehyde dehydrogenase [Calothrix sp. PCC 6303]AFZ03811.1 Aldehyde Dehydrogenase [Calothrix sp. PCC 6303]
MLAESSIAETVSLQRSFFATGKPKNIDFRIEQLKKLKEVIKQSAESIFTAVNADLNKPMFEAYTSELGAITQEIDYALKHIKAWTKIQKKPVSLSLQPASAEICPEPLGVVLIISPWNYPFALSITPLVGAIASGNCAIIKPSELAPHTSKLIAEIITKNFPSEYITVVEGGVSTSQELLKQKFDHIFFTGGTAVGKIIMEAAAKHLTPVTLELGGKSPCIVDEDVNIEVAAKRITWGKFMNSGQTCIAPDYIFVHKNVKQDLCKYIKQSIQEFYGENPIESPDYGRIIGKKHYQKLASLLTGDILVGGESNEDELYIAPTIIDHVTWEDEIMQDEIFGPILPIMEYSDIETAISQINSRPKPLALYIFSQDKNFQTKILQETSSGGVCINDTIKQVGGSSLPFGGVGDSGIGSYHGKASFDTFSHYKSILKRPFYLDLKILYPPYEGKLSLLKKLLG